MNLFFSIRPATEKDIPFVYSTWLKSYRNDSSWIAKETTKTIFFDTYSKVLDKILLNSNTTIACKNDDPNIIFGYIVHSRNIAHYCYVKEVFRQMGIASDLFNHIGSGVITDYTHRTKALDKIKLNIDYNPFLLSL